MDFEAIESNTVAQNVSVVRIRSSAFKTVRGIRMVRDITFMRKLSHGGYHIIEEDANNIGLQEVINRIMNLDSCKDGLYQVFTHVRSRDWETNFIDDYDYELIPFKEENDK